MKSKPKIDPLLLALKCFALIETTKKSGTYKYATFLALLHMIARSVDKHGRPTRKVMISDIGCEVMRLYWNQSVPFKGKVLLKQASGPGTVRNTKTYTRVGLVLL